MRKIPKWYQLTSRRELKRDIITQTLKEYSRKTKFHNPTEKDIEEYHKELLNLDLKHLIELNKIDRLEAITTISDKISKLKKRKALIIRIINKNKTTDEYIASKHRRLIKINEYKYLIPPEKGIRNNKYQMMEYNYYENNPFPIEFADDHTGTYPDAELLETTLHFEFAQKMAQMNKLNKKMDLTFIAAALAFLVGAVNLLLSLNNAGII